jgi:hypothetical protein
MEIPMHRLILLALFAAGCNTFTPLQLDGDAPATDAGALDGGRASHLELDTDQPWSFGALPLATSSSPLDLVVTNTGDVPTGALVVTSSADDFVIGATDCGLLAAHQSCHASVRFDALHVGPHSGVISISDRASPGVSRQVSGIATAQIVITNHGGGRIESDPDGLDCTTSCVGSFAVAAVTLHATPPAGGTFVGWSAPCPDPTSPTCALTLTDHTSVSAAFAAAPPPRTLIVDASSAPITVGGSVQQSCTVGTCAYSVPDLSAQSVTIDATGGIFVRWIGSVCDGVTTPTCDFTMSGDEDVRALVCPDGDGQACCLQPSLPACQCDATVANIPC